MMHVGGGANQFENGVEGYLGFKFGRLDDGNFTFGWKRVTLTNGSGNGTIHEWAYSDTPGRNHFGRRLGDSRASVRNDAPPKLLRNRFSA